MSPPNGAQIGNQVAAIKRGREVAPVNSPPSKRRSTHGALDRAHPSNQIKNSPVPKNVSPGHTDTSWPGGGGKYNSQTYKRDFQHDDRKVNGHSSPRPSISPLGYSSSPQQVNRRSPEDRTSDSYPANGMTNGLNGHRNPSGDTNSFNDNNSDSENRDYLRLVFSRI